MQRGPEQYTGMRDLHGQKRGDPVSYSRKTKDRLFLRKNFVWFGVFLGFLHKKKYWVVFIFRAEYLDFPVLHRERITYYRISLQGESQTHYKKKYLYHITVCKVMVQVATHVLGRKKNEVKPRKH